MMDRKAFCRGVREGLPRLAFYLMVSFIMGFLFFYTIFHYYAAPFTGEVSFGFLALALCAFGIMGGYLYPDIMNVLAMSMLLPVLGGVFCFVIFISPILSPDIISTGLSDSVFILARYLLPNLFMAFPVIFLAGFVSMHIFESEEMAS